MRRVPTAAVIVSTVDKTVAAVAVADVGDPGVAPVQPLRRIPNYLNIRRYQAPVESTRISAPLGRKEERARGGGRGRGRKHEHFG